jgi:hypothetical protein
MSSSCRPGPSSAAVEAIAERLASASLVRFLCRPDGDAVAATGVLARVLDQLGTPFQVSTGTTRRPREDHCDRGDDSTLTVGIGPLETAEVSLSGETVPLSVLAASVAEELDTDVSPELALAGVVAAGRAPGSSALDLLDRAHERGLARRPGVAVPPTDLTDGIAHSMWFHATWSGSPEETRAALDDLALDGTPTESGTLDEDDHRTIASRVSIEATDTPAPQRAAETIGRAVAPYATPQGPFETLGGYADVLDAVARERPGVATALAVGGDVRETALDAWRAHARRVHEGLRTATTGRYDGYVVARIDDAPVVSTAQLCRDVAAPEPLVVAVDTDMIGLAARNEADAAPVTRAVADAIDGTTTATGRYGLVVSDGPVDERTVIDTVREVT